MSGGDVRVFGPWAGVATSFPEPGLHAVQTGIDYRRGVEREELTERQPTSEVKCKTQ
jgi:hypothetical protein